VRKFSLLVVLFSVTAALAQSKNPIFGEKQVVIETNKGSIVLEVFPQEAPEHTTRFLERIRSSFYVGTTFHRGVRYGIIQGGDPLSRDQANFERYGSGGLGELDAEINDQSHVRGTVSAVLVPGNPDSAGSQFFICVTDQTQLDGQHTIFGRVVEGMEVAEQISTLEVDDQQRFLRRIEILKTYERPRPEPEKLPFADASPDELVQHTVRIKTDLGNVEIGFFPDTAAEHVRRFLQYSELGLYEGTTFHRVVPGFVIQGGSFYSRKPPVPEKYGSLMKPLKAEFNDKEHIRGIVSMARGEDPDSAIDSFFIVLEPQPSLDGKYTVFGYVVTGIDTVDGISQVPVRGEEPIFPVRIDQVEVLKKE
jgi:peptidyl-prolyl cis-trans isomerase B (cyclophilin B)